MALVTLPSGVITNPDAYTRIRGSIAADTHAHTALGNGTTRKLWSEFFRSLGLAMQSAFARPVALAA